VDVKYFLWVFSFLLFSWAGSCAASPLYLTTKQIIVANEGFFINVDGIIFQAQSIEYLGNGIYLTSDSYYGSCNRCGWPINKDGQCINRSCNQNGPEQK
jgi:hypothetical protein